MRTAIWALIIATIGGIAHAADQPVYEPPPDWVTPFEIPKTVSDADAGSSQLLLEDVQDRFGPDGLDSYWEVAQRVLTPQGLSDVGNIALDWNPDTEILIIHRARIIRGDQIVDLLAGGQKFIILRRENKLEFAMLDGTLTAAIEPEGLQVGDILDLAVSYRGRDPLLRGRSNRIVTIPQARITHFVIREIWPQSETLHWRETTGIDKPVITQTKYGTELTIDMKNAIRPTAPKQAPERFSRPGRLEISEVPDWATVSALMAPIYDKAATLKPDSPLRQEIDKIKAASSDPKLRAMAALRLVQDQVRYLFLGMNNGGYVPASADLSWARRFADCKGKTVLLLGLLRELGIKAEPALVDTEHGDDLDARPPMVAAFDHVVVRAEIDGKIYWMDGTRPADRVLENLPVPDFHWALPLRGQGAALEKLVVPPPDQPDEVTDLHLDASAGLDIPAPAHAELILRGDSGIREKMKLADMSKVEADKALHDYWTKQYDWITIGKVDARYDEAKGEEHFTMEGSAKMEWTAGRGNLGRRYETDGSILGWNADYTRDPGPDQNAPFSIEYPFFSESRESIVLPNHGNGFKIEGDDVDKTIAVNVLKRTSKIDDGIFTMDVSTRTTASEFSAAEAPAAQKALHDLRQTIVYLRAPSLYRMTDQELTAISKPSTADEFFNLAFQYNLRGDKEHAISNYDQAIKLRPDWALAHGNRGMQYFDKGEFLKAAEDYDKALELDPRNAVGHRGRGMIFAQKGQYKEAIDAFGRSLDFEPENAFTLKQRSRAYLAAGDLKHARSDLDEALKLDPDNIELHSMLLDQLVIHRDAAGLDAEANEFSRLKSAGLEHIARGYALIFQGKPEDARHEFDSVIAMKLDEPGYLGRSATYPRSEHEMRLKNLDAALKANPKSALALTMRAGVYIDTEKPQLAVDDLDALLQFAPGDNGARVMRALALSQLHRYDQAIADIDTVLGKQPGNPMLLNQRCWFLAISGVDLSAALKNCNASLGAKEDAATLDSRGLVYLKTGHYADAIADYDSALKLRPDMASSLFARGIAKRRSGKRVDGDADLSAARKINPKIDAEYAGYGVKP